MKHRKVGYAVEIKKNPQKTGEMEKNENVSFLRTISQILDEITEGSVTDDSNPQITGEDVYNFIERLRERARLKLEKNKKNNVYDFGELDLFASIKAYFRFFINIDIDRKYCSTEMNLKHSNEEKDFLSCLFKDLVQSVNNPEKTKEQKNEEDMAFNLFSTLFLHIYQNHIKKKALAASPTQQGKQQEESQQEKNQQEENQPGEKQQEENQYIPLNDYLKSNLITWDNLLKGDGKKEYGVYPFCQFVRLDPHLDTFGLIIASRLDNNYVDSKVKEIDKIGPIHFIIFNSRYLYLFNDHLKKISFILRNAVGYLSHTVLAARTNKDFNSLANESAKVSNYWFSDGIEKLFPDNHLDVENETGMNFAINICKEILCADIDGLKNVEVFPFDRIYIFPGSNYKAVKEDTGKEESVKEEMAKEEMVKDGKSPEENKKYDTGKRIAEIKAKGLKLNYLVMEGAIKSQRPGDGGAYLSSMERFDYEKRQTAEVGRYFDITRKKIGYNTFITFCLDGFKGNREELPKTLKSRTNEDFYQLDDEEKKPESKCTPDFLELLKDEKIRREKETREMKQVGDSVVRGFMEKNWHLLHDLGKDRGNIKDNKAKQIDAVISSLTARLIPSRRTPQDLCQATYDFYDDDGICFISDFAVNINGNVSSLNVLQEAYFKSFFNYNENYWKDYKWSDNKTNQPDEVKYKKWLWGRESKIVLISFDPAQNINNKGGYLDNETMGFTMVIVSDQDTRKNNFDISGEFGNLKQLIRMFIRRKLREAKLKKDAIRKQSKTFRTLMPTILHRVKNYLKDPRKKEEIDHLRRKIYRLLENESFKPRQIKLASISDVHEFFLGPFIKEQTGQDLAHRTQGANLESWYKETGLLLSQACRKYIEEKRKGNGSVMVAEDKLVCTLNRNYFPEIRLTLVEEFVQEAVKVLINNALEHTAIYAHKTGKRPEVLFSFNLIPKTGMDAFSFELSIKNVSEIDPTRLKQLNASEPKELEKDMDKKHSTGIGVFIARTQLKNVLGKDADIKYYNVGAGWVEAKLILSAEPAKATEMRDDKPETIGLKSNYILYVEDEEKIRAGSRSALLDIVGNDPGKLADFNNLQDAKKKIERSCPSIVLMDLGILKNQKAADSSGEHNGKKLLKFLLEKQQDIPIIILSGKSPEEINEIFDREFDLDGSGYRHMTMDREELEIEDRTIISTSIKDLSSEGDVLLRALKKWVDGNFSGTEEKNGTGAGEIQNNYKQISFDDEAFDDELALYRKDNISDLFPENLFVATANAADELALLKIISRWLLHKGLRSFYPDEKDEPELYPLAGNETYRTIFLRIVIPPSLTGLINYKFRYWCLPRNILISCSRDIDHKVAAGWKSVPHGVKGALGRLRHDLKNKMSGNLEKLLPEINKLERELLFTGEGADFELEKMLRNDGIRGGNDQEVVDFLKQHGVKDAHTLKGLFKATISAFHQNRGKSGLREYIDLIEKLEHYLTI